MPKRTYRFRVYNSDDSTYAFFIDHDDLAEIPERMGGQRVDVLAGRAESIPWELRVLDAGESFTARLSDAGGRAHLLNRLIDCTLGTNLLTRSEELDHADWNTNATITANDATAPDGTLTAEKVADDDAGVAETVHQAVTGQTDDSSNWAGTVFLKKRSAGAPVMKLRLSFEGGTTTKDYQVHVDPVDASTEVLGANQPTTIIARSYNADWWRVGIVAANNGSGNTTVRWQFFPANASAIGAGQDVTQTGFQHLWGAQLENADSPSTYQQTTSAAVDDVLVTGRILDIEQEDNAAVYRLRISDEQLIAHGITIFDKSGTTRIWPPGNEGNYRGIFGVDNHRQIIDPVTPFKMRFRRVAADGVAKTMQAAHAPAVPEGVRKAINGDIKPGVTTVDFATVASGAFRYLRFRWGGNDTDYEVLGFPRGVPTLSAVTAKIEDDQFILYVVIYDPNDDIAAASGSHFSYLYFPQREATFDLPYHIGGTDGIDPPTLVHDLWSGSHQRTFDWQDDGSTFSAQTVRHSTAQPAFGKIVGTPWKYRPVHFRITQPARLATWIEENISKPFGLIPIVRTDGKLQLRSFRPPDVGQLANLAAVDALHTFDASNSIVKPSWTHSAGQMVTSAKFAYTEEDPGPLVDESGSVVRAFDRLEVREVEATRRHDRLDAGSQVRRDQVFRFHCYHTEEDVAAMADHHSDGIFQFFGDGAQMTQIKSLSAASTVEPGDYAVINFPTFPNLSSQQKGGKVIVQVTSKVPTPDGYFFEAIHIGPRQQPLSSPSITLTRSASDPKHTIRASITSLPSTGGYALQLAAATSQPSTGSTSWKTVAAGRTTATSKTVDVGNLKFGTVYWGRAQARKRTRIASGYATPDSTSTQSVTAPSSVVASNVTATAFDLAWKVGDTGERVAVEIDGTIEQKLREGSNQTTVRALTAGTTYTVGVRHVGPYGGQTTATEISVATSTSNPQLAKPRAIVLTLGRDSTKVRST